MLRCNFSQMKSINFYALFTSLLRLAPLVLAGEFIGFCFKHREAKNFSPIFLCCSLNVAFFVLASREKSGWMYEGNQRYSASNRDIPQHLTDGSCEQLHSASPFVSFLFAAIRVNTHVGKLMPEMSSICGGWWGHFSAIRRSLHFESIFFSRTFLPLPPENGGENKRKRKEIL